MSTKTEQAEAELRKYTSIEDMKAHVKEIAEKVGCAKATVYKVINRIAESEVKETLPESHEPVVKIGKPEEVEIPTGEELEGEEVTGEENLPPSLLEEEPQPLEKAEEKLPEELAPDRGKRLADIFERSIERILNIPLEGLGLDKLTEQELDDSAFLVLLLLEKHADIEANTEEMLDPVATVHFTSIATRTIVGYLKKRREEEERKKAEEKPPELPKGEPPKIDAEQSRKGEGKQPDFLKRL